MFVNKEQLEYLLPADTYCSQEQLDKEYEAIFRPAWHLVGSTLAIVEKRRFSDLVDLLGRPLLIRNQDGRYSAYLNVCSHRHCLLTDKCDGTSETIRCQYHGWEYGENGRVSRMPDGGCFKPFDREHSRLQTFRLEVCGGLLFVSLADNPIPLSEYLGSYYESLERCSQGLWRPNWHWMKSFDCNWKIPLENTLETYHLPILHGKTFDGVYPSEEAQTHDLSDRGTTLRYQMDRTTRLIQMQQRVMRRLNSTPGQDEYLHHHHFPHQIFTFTDLFLHAQIYMPTSATTSRTEIWMFAFRGDRPGLIARGIAKLVARHGRKLNLTIQTEDAAIFDSQQRGIRNSPHPGCIGTREERIFVFQQYIASH